MKGEIPIPVSILATKLYAPTARQRAVRRQTLLDRLDAGLAGGCRLTLVCAPAGYGKSTLVRLWLATAPLPFSWLAVDENDNEPLRFLTYLTAALRQLGEMGQSVPSLLTTPTPPPVETLMELLINDLHLPDQLPGPVVLVLDDLHRVHEPTVHRALQFLVDHQPPALHLVILTREDPPLALPRLRTAGLVNEIRAQDLRFSPPEAQRFFREAMDVPLAEDLIQALAARTEGWVAGLQLAALSLRRAEPGQASQFVQAFSGSHRYIIDYLTDEVLRQQPATIRSFLLQTSILDRFNADLCQWVTGQKESARILHQLEQANLFLVPLDDRREWYRYHHLFRDALRAELEEHLATQLHQRAAGWWESHGCWVEATDHALHAGDLADAGRLAAAATSAAFRTAELGTLLGWLETLPQDLYNLDPQLSIHRAWALLLTGRLHEARAWASHLAARLGQAAAVPERVRGLLLSLRAWTAQCSGQSGGEALAQQALGLLGPDDAVGRIQALLAVTQAQPADQTLAQTGAALQEAYALALGLTNPFFAVVSLANLAFVLNEQGRRVEALQLCETAVRQHTDGRGQLLPIAHFLRVMIGCLQYEADELEAAQPNLENGLAACRALFPNTMLGGDGEATLALLHLAKGEDVLAVDIVQSLRQAAERLAVRPVIALAHTLHAQVQLQRGNLGAVGRWAAAEGLTGSLPPVLACSARWLVVARLLLAQGRRQKAISLLHRLAAAAERHGQVRKLITVRLLLAQALADEGQEAQAVGLVDLALGTAALEGYRRAFLDEGPALAPLLRKCQGCAPGFVQDLLDRLDRSAGPPRRRAAAPHTEPLSEREQELLRLVANGLSNKEIASQLVITVGTAKWHLHQIFSKLGVKRRTELVARAREAGLI